VEPFVTNTVAEQPPIRRRRRRSSINDRRRFAFIRSINWITEAP